MSQAEPAHSGLTPPQARGPLKGVPHDNADVTPRGRPDLVALDLKKQLTRLKRQLQFEQVACRGKRHSFRGHKEGDG